MYSLRLERIIAANLRSPAFWVIAIALLVASVANFASKNGMVSEASVMALDKGSSGGSAVVIREEQRFPIWLGPFRISGDRVEFVEQEAKRSFRCLENLMLQRVYQVIGDEPNETAWIVSGRITEFRGDNYLLIELLRRTK